MSPQSACARCGTGAAPEKLFPSCIPSLNAFVAIGVTADADAEPMDHSDLVDKTRYCRSCRRTVAAWRIVGIACLAAIALAAVYVGMQLF